MPAHTRPIQFQPCQHEGCNLRATVVVHDTSNAVIGPHCALHGGKLVARMNVESEIRRMEAIAQGEVAPGG